MAPGRPPRLPGRTWHQRDPGRRVKRKDARGALPSGMMVRCASTRTSTFTLNSPAPAAGTATWSTSPGGRGARASASSELVTSRTRCGGRSLARSWCRTRPACSGCGPTWSGPSTTRCRPRAARPCGSCCRRRSRRFTSGTNARGRCTTCSTRRRSRPSTRSPGRLPAWGTSPRTAGRSSGSTRGTCLRSRCPAVTAATWCPRTPGRRGSRCSGRSPGSTGSLTATPT